MKTFACLHIALMAVLVTATVLAQGPTKANRLVLDSCLVSAFDEVQLPGQDPGVLKRLEPNTSLEGTEVSKGDLLGELDSDDLIAKKEAALGEIAVAKALSESDAEVEAAIKTWEVADAEVKAADDAERRSPGSISKNELRRLKLTRDRAKSEIDVKKLEKANHGRTLGVKTAQLQMVDVDLARRKFKAPFDGVVVERMKHEGEWVQPGEAVLKIVRMDRLRIEGFVPADAYSPIDIAGAKVIVTIQLPDGQTETAEGKIEFVSPIVEASGEYRIWTEIKNRKVSGEGGEAHWIFRPGTVAQMDIPLRAKVAARPVSKFKAQD